MLRGGSLGWGKVVGTPEEHWQGDRVLGHTVQAEWVFVGGAEKLGWNPGAPLQRTRQEKVFQSITVSYVKKTDLGSFIFPLGLEHYELAGLDCVGFAVFLPWC